MPIGFWAISREEVKGYLASESGRKPTTTQVDRTIRILREALDETLQEIIIEQAKEIIFEEAGI